MATSGSHFWFMDVLYLAYFYVFGCIVGACLIAITNSVAADGLDIAPYDYALFSWGFVFWFLVLFVWLICKGK